MKRLFLACPLLILTSACASVHVNGYEVTRETQAITAVSLIAAGVVIHSLADSDAPDQKDQTNPGEIICKVNPETSDYV